MVKIPMRIAIVGHQESKWKLWKAQLFRVMSRVKTQNLDSPQAHKDEEPRNMLVTFKVIQTLGRQFGSFSQGTMCSYQMICQSSSLKQPQSCWVLPSTQNILHMAISSVSNDTDFLSTLLLMHPTMSKSGIYIFFIHGILAILINFSPVMC